MSWTVEKTSTQAEAMCGEHGLARVTSKSFFLAEDPKRRISRGYCRGLRERSRKFYWYGYALQKHKTRGSP